MKKLYDLTDDYNGLLNLVEKGEFTAEEIADTLEGVNAAIDDKIQSVVMAMHNIKAEADMCKAEADRLLSRKKSCDNQVLGMKAYLRHEMTKAGRTKSKGLFSVSIGKPSEKLVITNDEAIEARFLSTKIIINNADIKEAIKNGETVEGAEIIEGEQRLTIR